MRTKRTTTFTHYQRVQAEAKKKAAADPHHQELVRRVQATLARSRQVLAVTVSGDIAQPATEADPA